MKKGYCLVLFFLFYLSSKLLAQKEFDPNGQKTEDIPGIETVEKKSKNLLGIDFHYWGTSFHFATKIKKNLFMGFEIGGGSDRFDKVLYAGKYMTQENTPWSRDRSFVKINSLDQIIFFHVLARWKPVFKWFELDGGFRWAGYSRGGYYQSGHGIDDIGWNRFYGGYLKPSIGLNWVKIGVRIEIGSMDKDINEFVMMASPCLRLNFRK